MEMENGLSRHPLLEPLQTLKMNRTNGELQGQGKVQIMITCCFYATDQKVHCSSPFAQVDGVQFSVILCNSSSGM